MNNNSLLIKYQYLIVFLVLTTLIILFNSPDIFLAKTLFLDDYDRYVRGIENRVHELIIQRNFARAYIFFGFYKLLSVDVVLARIVLVILFYVPLAFIFFLLLRLYARLPAVVAFFASLLPCILPGQTEIPRFIDGSYTLPGMLVYLLLLWSSFKYLTVEARHVLWLASSVSLSLLSVEMMDQAVFMLPFSILAFYLITTGEDRWQKFWTITLVHAFIFIFKAILILNEPSSTSSPIIPTWEFFVGRSSVFFQYVLPFSYSIHAAPVNTKALFLVFFLLVTAGFMSSSKQNKIIITMSVLWAFFSSLPFLTISEYFSSRYMHIAGFGINTALIVSIWQIYNRLTFIKNNRELFIITAVSLCLYAGIARINHINRIITPLNNMQQSIEKTLLNYDFPEDSQIVILEKYRSPTHGWWRYSDAYMKYTLQRHDVSGLLGKERMFYQVFSTANRYFLPEHRMSGLDIDSPVFIFRQICEEFCTHKRIQYALDWKDGEWSLYKFDLNNGLLIKEYTGGGYDDYINTVKINKISKQNIAFGQGEPDG